MTHRPPRIDFPTPHDPPSTRTGPRWLLTALVILFVLAAADVARADEPTPTWEGWEPKRALPTDAVETLHEQAVWLIPPLEMTAPPPFDPTYRDVVEDHFPAAGVEPAMRVMWCESRYNPDARNPRSSAAGLFQFLRSTWDWVAPIVAVGTYDSGAVFDPVANIRAAAWLSDGGTNWTHWVCRP